jgi:hypothetical protein
MINKRQQKGTLMFLTLTQSSTWASGSDNPVGTLCMETVS